MQSVLYSLKQIISNTTLPGSYINIIHGFTVKQTVLINQIHSSNYTPSQKLILRVKIVLNVSEKH